MQNDQITHPPVKRAGRPRGSASASLAPVFRTVHFNFLRSLVEGIPLRRAWMMFMSHEDGPDHEAHFAARARELMRQVRIAAHARGLEKEAATALRGFRLPALESFRPAALQSPATAAEIGATPPMDVPPLPSLDEWIDSECARTGADVDFFTQAEWLEAYTEAMNDLAGSDQHAAAEPDAAHSPSAKPGEDAGETEESPNGAVVLPKASNRLLERINALNTLAFDLALPASLKDGLDAWLSPSICRCLAGAKRDGIARPIRTIDDLIDFISTEHNRWWVHVPRLGRVRAERILRWLDPLAERLDRPLPAIAKVPLQAFLTEQKKQIQMLEPESTRMFGLVPLDRLAVPPDLDGRHGEFRLHESNTFGASNDLEAINSWLKTHQRSESARRAYPRLVERFYLWTLLVKRKPMSSLNQGDLIDYCAFLANPPASWIQRRRTGKHTAEWRPFRGPLDQRSQRLDMTVISSMFASLHGGGYLRLNPAQDVRAALGLTARRIEIDRSFSEAQWEWLMTYWAQQYAEAGPDTPGGEDKRPALAPGLRRTKLLLELGATTGLRLVELVTTRRGQISRELVNGQEVWIAKIVGKGQKDREVVIYDDLKAQLDAHHDDMRKAGSFGHTTFKRTIKTPRPEPAAAVALPSPAVAVDDPLSRPDAVAEPLKGDGDLPLVGAVRLAFNRPNRANADVGGALDPTALYQSLKRFLTAAGDAAIAQGIDVDAERLKRASTHWLRHFFANNLAEDGVEGTHIMTAMGHASMSTTSVYLRQDRKTLVAAMNKMRRR